MRTKQITINVFEVGDIISVSEIIPANEKRRNIFSKNFEDGKALLNEVRWAMSANSNTMKMGMNPETDELYTTERVLDPIRVELDVSPYGEAEPAP